MKGIFAFALIHAMFGQEHHPLHDNHHSRVEIGMGVRLENEKRHLFIEPTMELVGKRIRPSVDAGVIVHGFEFLGGVGALRAGFRFPVRGQVKLTFIAERQWVLGGTLIPLGKNAEVEILGNTQVVKATLLFKLHHRHKTHH